MRTLRMVALCLLAASLLSTAAVSIAQPDDHTISLNLVDADLRDALTMLFRGTDKNFVLAGDANVATHVTVKLVGVDFESALQAIMQHAGLRAQVAGDIYTISAATTTPPIRRDRDTRRGDRREPVRHDIVTPLPDSDNTFQTSTGKGAEKVTDTIKILYGDAAEIASLFGGPVAAQRFANSLGTGPGMGYPGSWQGSQYRNDPYRRGYPGYQQQGDPYPRNQPYADPYRGYQGRGDTYRGYPQGIGSYGRGPTSRPSGSGSGWPY